MQLQEQNYNPPVFWMSLLTAAATFPLIFMGGLVTTYGAGMSVPNWPNSFGYNMFTFPISQWTGGIFYEHTHRLAGSVVGLMTIAVVVLTWKTDRRRWLRLMSLWLLAAVCVQGVLGGLRVVLNDLDFAIVHGISGQLFFCFVSTYCLMTSRLGSQQPTANTTSRESLQFLKKLAGLASCVVLMQLVVGAIMRHYGAGLAIPDFPASYGHILPPSTLDPAFRHAAAERFGSTLGINRVTLFQIWIHFSHRIGAALVTLAILTLTIHIFRRHRDNRALTISAITLLILLATQITLGILTVLWRKPADIASLHVAVGALVLMTTWLIFVLTHTLLRPAAELNEGRTIQAQPSIDGGGTMLGGMAVR